MPTQSALTRRPGSAVLHYPKSEAPDNRAVRDKWTSSDLLRLGLHAVLRQAPRLFHAQHSKGQQHRDQWDAGDGISSRKVVVSVILPRVYPQHLFDRGAGHARDFSISPKRARPHPDPLPHAGEGNEKVRNNTRPKNRQSKFFTIATAYCHFLLA